MSEREYSCFNRTHRTHRAYDNHDTFERVFDALEPYGFEDSSHPDDVCPSLSYGYYAGGFTRVQVMVNYDRECLREDPDSKEFIVQIDSDDPSEATRLGLPDLTLHRDGDSLCTDNEGMAIARALETAMSMRARLNQLLAEDGFPLTDVVRTPKPDMYFIPKKPTPSPIDQIEATINDLKKVTDLLIAGGAS
jgi:hypothetical protein